MQLSDGRAIFAADLGGGQALVAFDMNIFQAALDEVGEWRPSHYGVGSIAFFMRMEAALAKAVVHFDEAEDAIMSLDEEKVAADMESDSRVPPETITAVKGAIRLMKKYYPRNGAGFDNIQDFGINLDVNGRRAALDYSFIPKSGTYLAEMAAHMEAQAGVDGSLLSLADDAAMLAVLSAPPSAYFFPRR